MGEGNKPYWPPQDQRRDNRTARPMVYENYDILNRATVSHNQYVRALRRTIRERSAVRTMREDAQRCSLVPVNGVTGLASGDVPLMAAVRNERTRLPPFLAHYRALGVTRFLVVDDESSDGTTDYLADQPDVDLFRSDIRFQAARYGTMWFYTLAQRYGVGRWYVIVDVDEYLVYPGMADHPLPDLIASLTRHRQSRLLAPMIDLLPDADLRQTPFDPGRWPWDVAPYLDPVGYEMRYKSIGPLITGGPLSKLFGTLHLLQKYPVMFWDKSAIHYPDIHNLYPFQRSSPQIQACLLHCKLFADLEKRSLAAMADQQHAQHAEKYRVYYDEIRSGLQLDSEIQRCVRYEGPEHMAELGFMEDIDW